MSGFEILISVSKYLFERFLISNIDKVMIKILRIIEIILELERIFFSALLDTLQCDSLFSSGNALEKMK